MDEEPKNDPGSEQPSDPPLPPDAPTPRERMRKAFRPGVKLVDRHRRLWILPWSGISPILSEVRDKVFDLCALRKSVGMTDLYYACSILIQANYDVDDKEVDDIMTVCDEQELGRATITALIGPQQFRRTLTNWIAASFFANGINPEIVPAAMIPHVMFILVRTGRTLDQESYIESCEAAGKRAALLRQFQMPMGPPPQ